MDVVTKLKKCPKIKSVTVTEEKQLLLKWTKVEGAEKYAIKRALSDKGAFEHVAWSKKCEYVDVSAPVDVTCRYKIMAHKALEGKKASTKLSAVKSAIISDIPAPEKFSAEVKDGKICLKWEKSECADGYIINRRNDFYSQILPVGRTGKCEYTDEKIVAGQPYHYSVQAFIKTEEGERQGNFSTEAHCVYLDCGEILESNASFGKKISLKVRIVAGADGYILQRSEKKDGPFTDVAKTEQGIDIRLNDKVEKRLKTYFYRAVAYKNVEGKQFLSNPTRIIQVKSR